MKILFTGGGTAGHIFPIIAVSREIRKIYQGQDLELFYVGPKDDFSRELLSKEGFVVRTILAGKIRRYFGLRAFFQNVFDVILAPIGFCQAFFRVFTISPDLIFSKGGYGSFSITLSGWLLLVPIFLHESDVIPGLANRLLARLSLEVFVSFPVEKTLYLPLKKIISVGNPVRPELLEGNEGTARELFGLEGRRHVILIWGGSQGSQRLNDVLLLMLAELLEKFEVIHQTGQRNFKQVAAEAKAVVKPELEKYYHPFAFLNEEELKQAFAVSSLIVSRAGSGSIFEIASVGRPSILIPLPEAAQNHQLKNAYDYAASGTCLVIEEINFTPHFFMERIKDLFSRPEKLKAMSEATRNFARPQAAKIIARYLIDYLSQ